MNGFRHSVLELILNSTATYQRQVSLHRITQRLHLHIQMSFQEKNRRKGDGCYLFFSAFQQIRCGLILLIPGREFFIVKLLFRKSQGTQTVFRKLIQIYECLRLQRFLTRAEPLIDGGIGTLRIQFYLT